MNGNMPEGLIRETYKYKQASINNYVINRRVY